MNLNEARATEGVPVLADDDSVVVDSHVDRINNKTGGNDSDEENWRATASCFFFKKFASLPHGTLTSKQLGVIFLSILRRKVVSISSRRCSSCALLNLVQAL
ncbi:hypothetical protein P3S68_026157 [Capsicum galapagoense]